MPLHALSEYTASMQSRICTFPLIGVLCAASLAAQQAPPREPHELLVALNRIQIDPTETYKIDPSARIELRRGDGKLMFDEGYLAFFQPFEGKVTGAVFSGRGHILAAPRDPVEKQQLAHFLGAPVVDQNFATAYLRFTDGTAAELLREFQAANVDPQMNSALAEVWRTAVFSRNPAHSLRILSESFSQSPQPYFVASLNGSSVGAFDFVYDQAREEPQLFGQARKSEGFDFYDIWSAYRFPETAAGRPAFRATQYRIETNVHADNSISGVSIIRLHAEHSGDRLIPFQFSSLLTVETVTLAGQALFSFPDETTAAAERAASASDFLYVLLPHAVQVGDEIELTLRYHGNVIRNDGNGVLFVGARESWYPHFGDTASFAMYELTFYWPRKLRLVATGSKVDEREEGEFRIGHWRTDKPSSVAGFNLGEYASVSLPSKEYSIDVYANRQLEQALLNRIRRPEAEMQANLTDAMPHPLGIPAERMRLPLSDPRPADALKQIARDIDSSIRFYETYSGPFPVHELSVSQIPGTFGQGWPGLLYISTYSFLPAEAQQLAGLSSSGQEHFHDLVPFHEVAHQWWGNVVGWSSYRDQWINEGLASYLSLLFVDNQKTPEHKLRVWLDRFRKRLVEKDSTEYAPAEIGSLQLGSRLNSSRTPDGFDLLVYGKGAWVFHMLRELLREPSAKNPDTRFIALLHTLQSKYAYRALSTQDLQREVEAAMTPAMAIEGGNSMEWFFADWVRGTGIPHYRIEYSTRRSEKGFVIKGKLRQSGVASSFVAPVPIYSSAGGYLGRVIAGGPETNFRFVSAREPGKLLIDPQLTVLCVTER